MSKLTRPTTLSVDLKAIQSNAKYAKRCAPNAELLACVKADAYGHGMTEVAQALAIEVDAFGVASLDEALSLKTAGIDQGILLLEGCFDCEELKEAMVQGLWIVVHSHHQIEQLQQLEQSTQSEKQLNVWLKMDTGMHRLGFAPDEYADAYMSLNNLKVVGDVVHMTHFACAEELDNPLTESQIATFDRIAGELPGQGSLANSAGILSWQQAHRDWVRPGLMLYGVSPFAFGQDCAQHLSPAMSLTTQVIALQNVPAGQGVGYNQAWVASRDSRIAVAAIGYGDGYPRNTKNGAPVLVDGARAQLVGHVAMDMMIIDVTDFPQVEVGAKVELWGKNLSVAEVAEYSGYSSYELLTRVTPRARREYIEQA